METEEKFGVSRATEYVEQSKIALAGHESCHELTACMLSAVLGEGSRAKILIVGAGGTGLEIITAGNLELYWDFVAVEPSAPMLEIARNSISQAGLSNRTTFHQGYVDDLDLEASFDAAIMFGVFQYFWQR